MSSIALPLSAIFLAACLILTNVRLPQTMTIDGPAYSYGGYNTTLSAYITPPMSAGSLVTLTVASAPANTLDISMFPTQEGTIQRDGPIAIETNLVGSGFTSQFTSPALLPYAIWVVSYDQANFTIKVQGTWTPYYILNIYTVPAAFATFASLLSLYYFAFRASREKLEEQVIAEATKKKPKG